MIPKKLHYVWVGKNPLPNSVHSYINSWKKYCPDYQIIEWNEDNFDISSNKYASEAYATKKWAFVSDFIRLSVLYTYGGIYLDSDVELIKNLDDFLMNPAFSGFESNNYIPTGLMGAEAGNKWIGYLLSYYENRPFILPNGEYDLTTNTVTITNMTKELYPTLKLNNTYQNLEQQVIFFPYDYFCAKNGATGIIQITENTHAIHHFSGSWLSEDRLIYRNMRREIINTHTLIKKICHLPLIGFISIYLIECIVIIKIEGIAKLKERILQKLKII